MCYYCSNTYCCWLAFLSMKSPGESGEYLQGTEGLVAMVMIQGYKHLCSSPNLKTHAAHFTFNNLMSFTGFLLPCLQDCYRQSQRYVRRAWHRTLSVTCEICTEISLPDIWLHKGLFHRPKRVPETYFKRSTGRVMYSTTGLIDQILKHL